MFTLPGKSAVKSAILYIVLFFALLSTDVITKDLVVEKLPLGRTVPLIEDIFHFTYVRNTGAAFGIFENSTLVLSIVSVIILLVVILLTFRINPEDENMKLAVCLICAGAVGNLVDRVSLGYVIDFIDVRLINFAIFNLADCFVCIGAFLMVVHIMFHKE